MSLLPSNFDVLSPQAKLTAAAAASGMTEAQWSAMPGEQKTAMLLYLKGYSVQGTASDMLGAAKVDAFTNRVGEFVSGMSTGLKIASIAVIVGIVWLMLPAIKAAPSKVRKAVA